MNRRDFLAASGAAAAAVMVGESYSSAFGPGTVIDFRRDVGHASQFDIFDAATGEKLTGLPIFYADERRGLYRVYLRDDLGSHYFRFTDARTGLPVEIEPGTWFDDNDGTSSATERCSGRTIKVRGEIAWEEVRRPIRLVPKADSR